MINIIEIPKKITHIDVLIKDKHIIEVPLPGLQGKSGKSSYEIAVDNGFIGTENDWLLSLKGKAFTYEDFTEEQLANLKGEKGDTGETGPRGATGEKGEKGDPGETGSAGYTPEKGVDYWTVADQTAIVDEVMARFENLEGVSF